MRKRPGRNCRFKALYNRFSQKTREDEKNMKKCFDGSDHWVSPGLPNIGRPEAASPEVNCRG